MTQPADVATVPIDPVNSPEAYRRELLRLLGDDDPAIVQSATVARLRELAQAERALAAVDAVSG